MIFKHYTLLTIISIFIISGCNTTNENPNDKEEKTIEKDVEKTEDKKCIYSVNNANATLYWTAYKHTQKVEVKGTIDSILLKNTVQDESITSLIQGTAFTIFPNSVNSNDEVRDKKIRDHFFGNMKKGNIITGNITEYSKNGKAQIELTLNGQTFNVPSNVVIENEVIQLRSEIDFNNWKTTKALNELNKVCEEKHTGIDGQSIFWPNAKILVEVNTIKKCL